jgi:pyruvate dehydrogenase (quinone)
MANVADLLIQILHQGGIRRVYGLVGDSLNGVTESLRKQRDIEWIHVRHEEVAAFAAGAEAHLTGALAVCAGSCGPGNLHLINGLFDCHRSRVPVVAIAAHIPSQEIGLTYFQETHPQQLFKECSHYCELVSSPAQLPGVFETAIRVAVAERGVAVIVLPGDVGLLEMREGVAVSRALLPPPTLVRPRDSDLDSLAAMLNRSARVTMLCGRGCYGAHETVIALADALKAPVVHALDGKEALEFDNPFDVGMTGPIGFSSGYHAMRDCDMLLMLGTDFPYQQFYPSGVMIAQVDIRGENLGRRCALDIGLVGDVRETVSALLPRLSARHDRAHLNDSLANYRKARRGLDELAVGTPGRQPIHPQYLAKMVSDMVAEDAIFTCDVGTPTIWAARCLKMNGLRRLIGSFSHGSMANALPQAISAQATFPGRQVIALCGDGSFTMLMGDMLTLIQQKLPVKIIVFSNGTLGFVEMEMKASGFLDSGVELVNPNFARLAEAAGLFGRRVEDPEDLSDAIRLMMRHDGPALLDVVTARQELAMPPKTSGAQVAGFSMWLLKAVLNGRGDQVIDLARTNLLR